LDISQFFPVNCAVLYVNVFIMYIMFIQGVPGKVLLLIEFLVGITLKIPLKEVYNSMQYIL